MTTIVDPLDGLDSGSLFAVRIFLILRADFSLTSL